MKQKIHHKSTKDKILFTILLSLSLFLPGSNVNAAAETDHAEKIPVNYSYSPQVSPTQIRYIQ